MQPQPESHDQQQQQAADEAQPIAFGGPLHCGQVAGPGGGLSGCRHRRGPRGADPPDQCHGQRCGDDHRGQEGRPQVDERPAGQRPGEDSDGAEEKPGQRVACRRGVGPGEIAEHAARLGEIVAQLVRDDRQVRDHDQRHSCQPPRQDAASLPRRTAPQVRQVDDRHRQRQHRRGHVRLHRHGAAGRGHEPPPWPARPPCLPRAEEGDRRARLHDRGIPDEGRVADQAGRDGSQQGGRQARGRPPDRPGDPPHDWDDEQAQQGNLRDDEGRVAVAEPRRRQEQVVIEGPMVEIEAHAGRRPEGRQVAADDRVPKGQHLRALVGVPAAANGQVHQANGCGRGDDRGQTGKFANLDAQAGAAAGHGPSDGSRHGGRHARSGLD